MGQIFSIYQSIDVVRFLVFVHYGVDSDMLLGDVRIIQGIVARCRQNGESRKDGRQSLPLEWISAEDDFVVCVYLLSCRR